MSTHLAIRSLRKNFGGIVAVDALNYEFGAGRITTVLGPSGSGKSTTLGILAGLIDPDGGSVHADGEEITRLPAEARNFGMVFQNYALFPHMTVLENVEFGLRVRGVSRGERRAAALEFLSLVRIDHLAGRRVHQISGGEQQRAALARALAFKPKVLLMDEPLSALDAKLRELLRVELHRLLKSLAITTIYVTHDQVEAMSLGDQMVIMNRGRIEQSGAPFELYSRPANPFVASFLGSTNLVEGECQERDERHQLHLPFATIPVSTEVPLGPCLIIIRPEDLLLAREGAGDFVAEHESSVFLGNQLRLHLRAGSQSLTMDVPNEHWADLRARIPVQIKTAKLCVLPREPDYGT